MPIVITITVWWHSELFPTIMMYISMHLCLVLAAGNDFSSAKELKAEIRSVYAERDRLEGLVKKLQALSTGSGLDLTRMKEQHNHIKLELQERAAQYGEQHCHSTHSIHENPDLEDSLAQGGAISSYVSAENILSKFGRFHY